MDDITKARINKAEGERDGLIWTPRDCLVRAIELIDDGSIDPNKLLIGILNDRSDELGRMYEVSFLQSGCCMSELLAMTAYLQNTFIKEMGGE